MVQFNGKIVMEEDKRAGLESWKRRLLRGPALTNALSAISSNSSSINCKSGMNPEDV